MSKGKMWGGRRWWADVRTVFITTAAQSERLKVQPFSAFDSEQLSVFYAKLF